MVPSEGDSPLDEYHSSQDSILALIPARGGSKRLPRKNLRLLQGHPLIEWTIRSALASSHGLDVVVSTDDPEIANIAVRAGARVPFLRPEHLASDSASSTEVIIHALASSGHHYDSFVLLQPTSPFRRRHDIDNVIRMARDRKAEAIVSVCPMEHSPLWANTLPENGSMVGFLRDDIKGKNSQQLPPYYRLNGSIYYSKTDIFEKEKTFFLNQNVYAYEMPAEYSIDIDNQLDLDLAEFLAASGRVEDFDA